MRLDQLNSSEEKFSNTVESLTKDVEKTQKSIEVRIQDFKLKFDSQLIRLNEELISETEKLKKQLEKARKYNSTLEKNLASYKVTLEREARAENKQLKERIKELEAFIDSLEFVDEAEEEKQKPMEEDPHFLRARTLAIFQKILMMISKWSDVNPPAEDFEIISRSVLIPSVYNRISNYEPQYLLKEIPDCRDLVLNGRKYISILRKEYLTNLSSKKVWEEATEEIKIWWTDYALPGIFGWKDDRWDSDPLLEWDQSQSWETNAVDQMTMFPRIYDTMFSMRQYESLSSPLSPLSIELEDPQYKY